MRSSKESAAALPVVLLAWAALAPGTSAPLRARLIALAPSGACTAAYLILRRQLLAAEHLDLPAMHLDFRPLRIVASLGTYLANTWPLTLESGVRDLPIADASSGWFLARTAVVLALFAAAAVYAHRKDRTLLALLAWVLAALAPVVLTRDISVPTGADKLALSDRWLFHA